MADISTFDQVQENFFVEVNIDGSYTRFSDYHIPYTIDSNSYTALGSLLGITNTRTEIRATNQQLTITLSGLPSSNLAMVQNSDLKGSAVTVHRALFNPVTGALLGTTQTNPVIKFKGIITNFGIQESWNTNISNSTFTLSLQVQSVIGQLLTKTAGRRTNPNDEKKFFSSDVSFDRVPTITNANYNFGAPDFMPRVGTK